MTGPAASVPSIDSRDWVAATPRAAAPKGATIAGSAGVAGHPGGHADQRPRPSTWPEMVGVVEETVGAVDPPMVRSTQPMLVQCGLATTSWTTATRR